MQTMTIIRIARPEEGPLDFLASLQSYKQEVLRLDANDPITQNIHRTWDDVRTLLLGHDREGMKHYQTRLAPWPPVMLLALEPQTSPFIHAGWQMLLEMHTTARWMLERPALEHHPQWVAWKEDLVAKNPKSLLQSPAQTSIPGVLREGPTLAVVSTQPFSFMPGCLPLNTLVGMDKTITDFRLHTPAGPMVDPAHKEAACSIFGVHSVREISKLAFWSMVNTSGNDIRTALKWRPRYYGGPSGTPSWGLHDIASTAGQVASKARVAMVDWMLNLSDSMVEQLGSQPVAHFSTAHVDFLQAYTRSLNTVATIGVNHKRTIGGINELLGYTLKVQDHLQQQRYPMILELHRANHRIKQQLRVEQSTALML